MYNEELGEDFKREYFERNLKAAKISFVESMRTVAGAYLSDFGVEKNFDEGDISAAVAPGEIYQKKYRAGNFLFVEGGRK